MLFMVVLVLSFWLFTSLNVVTMPLSQYTTLFLKFRLSIVVSTPAVLAMYLLAFPAGIWILLSSMFMLLIALIGKIWYQERDMIVETNARILETQTMLEKVAKERETLARRQAVLQKFCENLNSDREALNFLFRLTSLLPDNMYVTSFASTGNRISATIIYTGERIALLERLATLQGYRLAEDTKTTQNADNKSSTAQVVWNKDTDLK